MIAGETPQQLATTSQVAMYTVPAGAEYWLAQLRFINVAGTPCWIKVWIDADGTTYNDTTLFFPQQTIGANGLVFDVGTFILKAGGSIAIQAQANNNLGVHATGVRRT